MAITVLSEVTEFRCGFCGKTYYRNLATFNTALATKSLCLGPMQKVCRKCKNIRSNEPFDEYINQKLIDKVLLHIGFWCKYDFIGVLISYKEHFLDVIKSKNPLDYIGFMVLMIFGFFAIYLGLMITLIMNFPYIPFGLIINNIRIMQSKKRTSKVL